MPGWVGRRWAWAVKERAWFFYIGAVTIASVAVWLLVAYDIIGEATTTIKRPRGGTGPDASDLVLVERTTETSIPILAVLTALTGVGWLALPLRYLWDERSRVNEYQRKIRNDMVDRIHELIETAYNPEVNRINRIIGSADDLNTFLQPNGSGREAANETDAAINRLAFAIGRFHAFYLHHEHVQLFFRTRREENGVRDSLRELIDEVKKAYGEAQTGDFILARAVLVDPNSIYRASELKEVDFLAFLQRLQGTGETKGWKLRFGVAHVNHDWESLRRLVQELTRRFQDSSNVEDLSAKAKATRDLYEDAIAGVYQEWYDLS